MTIGAHRSGKQGNVGRYCMILRLILHGYGGCGASRAECHIMQAGLMGSGRRIQFRGGPCFRVTSVDFFSAGAC